MKIEAGTGNREAVELRATACEKGMNEWGCTNIKNIKLCFVNVCVCVHTDMYTWRHWERISPDRLNRWLMDTFFSVSIPSPKRE